MRFGILLILMQSMLLCAEGRAESVGVELDSADKVVRILLQSDPEQPQVDQDPAIVPDRVPLAALFTQFSSTPVFTVVPLPAARTAHTIRGPPARQ